MRRLQEVPLLVNLLSGGTELTLQAECHVLGTSELQLRKRFGRHSGSVIGEPPGDGLLCSGQKTLQGAVSDSHARGEHALSLVGRGLTRPRRHDGAFGRGLVGRAVCRCHLHYIYVSHGAVE